METCSEALQGRSDLIQSHVQSAMIIRHFLLQVPPQLIYQEAEQGCSVLPGLRFGRHDRGPLS